MANATLPSALQRFTSVFGMDTGGSTALSPPGKFFTDLSGTNRNSRRLARQGEVQDEPTNLKKAEFCSTRYYYKSQNFLGVVWLSLSGN